MSKVRLVVFDWAGTTVDYGCIAPLVTFKKTFEEKGNSLTKEEILEPMGMEKKDHIRTILQMPQVSKRWEDAYKRAWTEEDVDALYEIFEKSLAQVVADYSKPILGVVSLIEKLKREGIHIGSTTGYTGKMMEKVIPKAKAEGYEAEYVVTPEVVGSGRPAPFMIYENMRKFNVYPVSEVVKVGDTVMDILEGVNAGVWTVGILEGASELGLSLEEKETMSETELNALKEKARDAYTNAKADFIIEKIEDLPQVIEEINSKLKEREE